MAENGIAAAYIRVSTEEQLEYSPDSQLKKVGEYAVNNGFELKKEFIFADEGISGRQAAKRPEFMRMILLAKTKPRPFNAILVWKFSRFARSREDSIVYKSMLRRECGIDVISVSEQIGGDKTSILIEALLEAMDEYYSVNLAEEVKRGMNEKFSQGGIVSRPPFGYRAENGVFIPDERTAPTVKAIFADYAAGMSLRGIAAGLNESGVRSANGNLFEDRTIGYILSNPVYVGKLRRNISTGSGNAVTVDGMHEPIIDEELFGAVRERLCEGKKRRGKYSREKGADFMLRGLVRCSDCGATLVQAVKGVSLQCYRYARGQCGVSHGVSISKISAAAVQKLKKDLAGRTFTFNAAKGIGKSDKADIGVLIEKERQKLERIKAAFECGIDSIEEYAHSKATITARIAALENRASEGDESDTEDYTKSVCATAEELLDRTLTEEEKNRILRSIISEIVFDRAAMTIRAVYFSPF